MTYKITVPVERSVASMKNFCARFDCECKLKDKKIPLYEITTNDPVNFFWLGCNISLSNFVSGVCTK